MEGRERESGDDGTDQCGDGTDPAAGILARDRST